MSLKCHLVNCVNEEQSGPGNRSAARSQVHKNLTVCLVLHHSQTIPHFPPRVRSVTEGCGASRRGLTGKIAPVLMSSDMPAVATPPAYKCTCSSKDPPYRTTSLCPLNFTSVLCRETSNHIPNRLLSSDVTTHVLHRSRSVQIATSLGHIGVCYISLAKRAPNVSSPRLKIVFRIKHTHERALTGVFR